MIVSQKNEKLLFFSDLVEVELKASKSAVLIIHLSLGDFKCVLNDNVSLG